MPPIPPFRGIRNNQTFKALGSIWFHAAHFGDGGPLTKNPKRNALEFYVFFGEPTMLVILDSSGI